MNSKKLFYTILIFAAVKINAQQYERRQEFTVMNPTSFEMSRFDLAPVNKYTGKANVVFPLCSIEIDDKEIAFSLSYDTGGVRVAQEASWVGLGWNLGGIPVITHQINQRSDIGNNLSKNTGYCFEPSIPEGGITDEYAQWVASSPNIPYGQPDTQPDVFVASLIGSTVKYQLKKESNNTIDALILDESNAKITYDKTDQTFVIIDEEGYQYNFTHVEYTTTWTQSAGFLGSEDEPDIILGNYQTTNGYSYRDLYDRQVPSAWYVDKIISPDGDTLEFTYDDEIDNVPNATVSHPVYSSNISLDICALSINGGSLDSWQFANFENVSASRSIQEVKILTGIENTTTGDKIIFNNDARLDLHPYTPQTYLDGFPFGGVPQVDGIPKRLTGIEIYSPTGDNVKTISFQQSYFNEYLSTHENAPDYLRLKLDGFKVYDQQYAFKYKCDDALPKKHSRSTDFWGFYNGVENAWRVPYVRFEGNCPFENPSFTLDESDLSNGAKKGSSFEHTIIGSLEEIRYPTGGKTEFLYEKNEVTINPLDNELNADDFNVSHISDHIVEAGYPIVASADPDYKTYPVGGLRIGMVTNTDKEGNPLLRKSYSYQKTFASGVVGSSGTLMDPLHFFRYSGRSTGDQSPNNPVYSGALFHGVNISNNNVFGTNNSAMGTFMGYSQVTEIIESTTNGTTNGKIVSEFINYPNESLSDEIVNEDTGQIYQYIVESIPFNYENANGKLIKQVIYDNNDVIQKIDEFEYLVNVYSNVSNPDYYQVGYKLYFLNQAGVSYIMDYHEYDARKMVTWLTKSKSTEELEDGQLITAQLNEYNAYDRLRATEKTTSKTVNIDYESNLFNPSNSERTEFYYPYDVNYGINNTSISSTLLTENRISQPLYTRFYNNDNFVGHQLTTYALNNGFVKPQAVYFDKRDIALEEMDERVKYEVYDDYGNLVQYRQSGGVPITALWGYNGKYMVAKIENTTYQQIEDLIEFGGGTGLDLNNSGLTQQQKDALNSLSNTLSVFYDYEPLVGITKMTDSRGYETNYDYDQFNRLVEVRDGQNNLIKDYQYAFADVTLYPDEPFSDCFNLLTIDRIRTTNNRVQYFSLEADVSGGFGNYTYKWYVSTGGTSPRTATFGSNPNASGNGFLWEVCCDTQLFIKLEVSDGTQTVTRIIENPNYNHPECSPTACNNPF
ncbi:hypothetical protein [Flagellimonas sp.]|uniref:hypothetical protein n=1 Tax=Flagellimonas sp. TaxID=2058762 RepID=UPI003BAD96E5